MRGLLPSVWLVAAALYTGSVLSLLYPFSGDEEWPAPPPVRETVVAKLPPPVTTQALPGWGTPLVLAALPTKSKLERPNEWVQVGAFTTIVRSRPSAEAPPLQAYTAGRALRVIAREGSFVRVQDLGSGQLGWVEQAALVAFGSYEQRKQVAEPLVAALDVTPALAEAPVAEEPAVSPEKPDAAKAAPKKTQPPRNVALAAAAAKEAAGTPDPAERGFFRKRRMMERVAMREKETGMVSMVDRAIRGF